MTTFFDPSQDHNEVEVDLWHLLYQAAQRGSHPMHFPTLATIGDGGPKQRTLVLRETHTHDKRLLFYTDGRSDKVVEVEANPSTSVHFYHPSKKLQLRLSGKLHMYKSGSLWEEQFEKLPPQRYFEYSSMEAPGNPIDAVPDEYQYNREEARINFRVLLFFTDEMEALQLNGQRHFRLLFRYSGKAHQAQWLQP